MGNDDVTRPLEVSLISSPNFDAWRVVAASSSDGCVYAMVS